ncbi:MAG: hypothetical protein IJP65_04535 [Bacteroidales bacterium]|nr:hypothetical protein [Bacteroidales bacterium]
MRTLNKIKIAIAALFVCLLGMAPLASFSQNENGVTDQGESTTKVNGSYVNENGKFVCWPRVTSYGKLLKYAPIATTDSANNITGTAATLYGNVLHDGWCGLTVEGFEVSTDLTFTPIVATVTITSPTFTPCDYPDCICDKNKYSKEVTGLTPGTHYYYRAYATNDCGTGYGDTLKFETPGAAFTVSVTPGDAVMFCPDATGSQNVTYTVSYSPNTITSPTFQWYFDDVAVSGETGITYTHIYTNSVGNHTVKCEVTSSGVTRDGSVTTSVDNYTVASLSISGDASICAGATGNLTATTGFSSYDWSSNVASSSTNTATYTSADTYTVTATTSDGCTATASTSVTVTNPNLAGTFSASSANICSGVDASLTATYTGSYSGTLSYQWYQDSGASKIALSGKTSSTLDLTAPVTAGDYTCVLTHTLNGCSSTMEAVGNITVNTVSVDITSLTAAANPVCSGESTTVTPTMGSYSGTLSYAWSTGASGTGVPGAITTGALTSNTTYKLTVTATTGSCSVTATKSITITVTNTTATTNNVASVTCVSATLSGSNTACSDARGFVYSSTNSTPTVGGTGCTNISVTNGTGSFTNALSGLTPNTTYYVQAYSHSGSSYFYGGVKSFTTEEITLTMHAQDDTINLCQEPKQAVVTISAEPNCDADNAGNRYAWSLSTSDPYTVAADGKSITVTVTSSTSEQINVSATCTLTHSTGYTVTATDYSIIYKEGTSPDICVCEDSYNGTVAITDVANINASTIQWYEGTDATGTPITALNGQTGINTGSYDEGYYTIKCASPLGCVNTRTVTLGFPFTRCASLGTTGNTSENANANVDGVWRITDNRSANGNTSTTYRVIKIGSQCWMAENLRYKQAVDGLTAGISRNDLVNKSIYTYPIYFTWPEPGSRMNNWTAAQDWSAADVTARYGYLYTWVGAMDMPATIQTRGTLFPPEQRDYHIQGVCPDGWHLPTDGEFFQLEHELGVSVADSNIVTTCIRPDNEPDEWRNATTRGSENDAGTVAATGCDWVQNTDPHCPQDYCYDVRNDRGFSAVPAGVFVPQYDPIALSFQIVGQQANFWTASQAVNLHVGHDDFSDAAYTHHLIASKAGWGRYRADKHNGLSVRCVRDMVTTATPTNVTTSSATVGGEVLEDAGYAITERGICWSNTGTPSISGAHRAAGSGVGPFTMNLTSADIPSGEYQYCAYAINSEGVYYGLTKTVQILAAPSVTTGSTSDISTSPNTITLHGTVTADGGDPATTRGICWSTSANPTTSDNSTQASGTGTGDFSVTISSGLASATEYHYRAWAHNNEGTTYGEDKTFRVDPCAGQRQITIDGDNYTLIPIGSQCWTASLHVTQYSDGTPLVKGYNPAGSPDKYLYTNCLEPADVHTPYYYEPYDETDPPGDAAGRITVWGRLYNYYAATRGETGARVQGLCPDGWHIPTVSEFTTLMAGAQAQVGASLPYAYTVTSKNTWYQLDADANTTVGTPAWGCTSGQGLGYANTDFVAYPVGIFNKNWYTVGPGSGMAPMKSVPHQTNQVVNFWCSDIGTYPKFVALQYNQTTMSASGGGANYNDSGFSVRCVKD